MKKCLQLEVNQMKPVEVFRGISKDLDKEERKTIKEDIFKRKSFFFYCKTHTSEDKKLSSPDFKKFEFKDPNLEKMYYMVIKSIKKSKLR